MIRLKEYKKPLPRIQELRIRQFISDWNFKSALFNPNWPVRKIKPNTNYEPGCLPVDTKDPVELMFQKQRDEFSAKSAANRLSEWTKSY